ncbi:MAG: DUF3592 domain-containing protein [Phycisphaerae bacterium]|nr:DUF3592 domain-containing protein [Phycisphaerae bacterium]
MKRSRIKAANPKTVAKYRRQILVGWIFALAWLVFVGAFDVYVAWAAARQVIAARTWTPVPATIVSSEIISTRGRKGKTTQRPAVSYSYSVDGKQYTGSTIEAFGMRSGGKTYAQDIAGAYRQGESASVFVDPADPSRSALRVGLEPATMRMLLFSLPFNAVLLGLIPFLIRARSYAADPMLGWVVVDEPDRAVLRVLHWEPWTLGCLAMGVASFVGIFVVLVSNRGEPPAEHVLGAIGGSVLVGAVLYAWRRAAVGAGRFDIEIDRTLKRITLPRTSRGLERPSCRSDQLEVSIQPDLNRQINHAPTWQLHLRTPSSSDAFIVKWLERPAAKLLGRWLADECSVRLITRPVPSDETAEEKPDQPAE